MSRCPLVRVGTALLLAGACAATAAGCARQRAEMRQSFAAANSRHQRELLAVNREDFPDPKDPGRAKPTTTGSTFVRDLALMSKPVRKTLETRGVPAFFSWDREGTLSFVYDFYYPDQHLMVRVHKQMSGDKQEELDIPEGDMRLIEMRR